MSLRLLQTSSCLFTVSSCGFVSNSYFFSRAGQVLLGQHLKTNQPEIFKVDVMAINCKQVRVCLQPSSWSTFELWIYIHIRQSMADSRIRMPIKYLKHPLIYKLSIEKSFIVKVKASNRLVTFQTSDKAPLKRVFQEPKAGQDPLIRIPPNLWKH